MANVKGRKEGEKKRGEREKRRKKKKEREEEVNTSHKRARNRFCAFSELLQTYPQETTHGYYHKYHLHLKQSSPS